MRRLYLGFFIISALMPALFADLELGLTDSGDFTSGDYVVIDSSGTVVSHSGAVNTTTSVGGGGAIIWVGTLGNYALNIASNLAAGTGSPALPAGTLSLNAANSSNPGSSGPLDIFFSETGVTPAFANWDLTFTGTLNSGSGATIKYQAFEDNGNAFFAHTTPIGTIGPFGPGLFIGSGTGSITGVAAPYSLTQEILLSGVGTTNLTGAQAALSPVPEPFSVLLFGTVVLLCASGLRRRLKSRYPKVL